MIHPTLRFFTTARPYVKRSVAFGVVLGLIGAALPASARDVSPTMTGRTDMPIQALHELSSLQQVRPLSVTVPNIERFTSSSGVPVAFVRATTLPIVDVDLRFNAGSARDGSIRDDGFGIASMAATMLTQGTDTLDEEAFTKQMEMLGISLSSSAYKDMFIVSMRSLSDSKHLEPASELMTQMLTQPRFDKAVLARNKARLQVALQQQQQDPSSLAGNAFDKALYGDHPYAHPSEGTLDTVPTLSQSDLQNFRKRFLVAGNASLAITGNLTIAEAKQLADQLTQDLPKGSAAPALPEPKPLKKAEHIHIPFPSTQTTVVIGQLGEKRATTPEAQQQQTNFAIGNEVMAGSDFNARLMTEIRQKRGYTYGISGAMTPMLTRGPYLIGFSTRNDKAREAIDASLDVIKDTVDDGITQEEMQLTKDNLKHSFPMGFASNSGINGLLGMMNFYQLPNDYLASYTQRIDNVSLQGVNQTLKQTLTPDNFLIVTVGQDDPWQQAKNTKKENRNK